MKNYLVTGGAGFIGSNFIHFLMKKYGNSVHVINLDSLAYCGRRSNLQIYEGNDNYQFIHGDICNEELVQQIFSEFSIDYVVHFAAQTHVDRSISSAKEFVSTNVVGTLNLLNSAREAWEKSKGDEKRFLYVSTDEVYGELPEGGHFAENSPIHPRNPYSASKASAEMLALAFYETHHLPVLITRCSNNYGPYQFEEKFIPLCIKCCLTGKEIPVYGDGENIRDWLFVDDHCNALDKVLQNAMSGAIYNIGGHNEHTNIEIVNSIRSIISNEYKRSVSPINFVEDRKGHDRRYAIDPTKINAEIGWHSETQFQDGLHKTIQWYLEHESFLNI